MFAINRGVDHQKGDWELEGDRQIDGDGEGVDKADMARRKNDG